MKEYQQRVIEERNELKARADKLNSFIGLSPDFDKVEPEEQERMKVQLDLMWQYYEVLESRIAHFGPVQPKDNHSQAELRNAKLELCNDPSGSGAIVFYEFKYYMLSNFSAFQVRFAGVNYPTSEHAYQAMKFNEAWRQLQVKMQTSAHLAMKLAQSWSNHYRKNWNAEKVDWMYRICSAKCEQHPYIQRKLLETGDRELIEASPIDSFWGWGPDKQGCNELGKVWMRIREELQTKGAL